MKDLRKTKIVGTIGPASEHKLKELFEAGLNVTRINYSHGSWDEQSEKTEEVIRLRKELDIPVALLLDMQGPEIRTGMLVTGKNEKIPLEDGQKFTLVNEDIVGDKDKVSVSYKELYKDVQPGTKILIDDGAIELKVDEVVGKDIVCTVVHGNGLGSRKTMNLPGTVIRLPGLAEKDIADLKTACEHDYDFVAISFARNLDDIRQVRKVLDENGGKDIQIITKIENVEGLNNEVLDENSLIAELQEKAQQKYLEKVNEVGENDIKELERVIMLKVVDEKWMNHIDSMEELKDGIGLRAYGQQDPVVKYRMEGMDMFEEMTANIKYDVVKILLNIRKQGEVRRQETAKITGAALEAINSVDGGKSINVNENQTVRNEGPKVGRNEPCPCGSR